MLVGTVGDLNEIRTTNLYELQNLMQKPVTQSTIFTNFLFTD